MITKYDYNREVHIVLLEEQIEGSSIVTALERIDCTDSVTSVHFKAAISVEDKATLDSIVAAHVIADYVSPVEKVVAEFVKQEESDDRIPYVYASPRPMNHYSYFSGRGDSLVAGDGSKLLFELTETDTSKTIDVSFIEDVYLKDGLILSKGAPFGATVDIDIIHPLAGYILSFGKCVPVFSDYPIQMNTEDRAFVPKGMIVRVTVRNSSGANGEDAPASFKVFGRLELYRPKP